MTITVNAQTGTYEHLVQAGAIDPAQLGRSAFQNAVSIASRMVTTEALISQIHGEQDASTSRGGL